MKIVEKLHNRLNENFRVLVNEAVKEKFGIEIETNFNIFTMDLMTTRVDEEDFTQEQIDFLKAYEAGYLAAMNQVNNNA
jgi:hypothetical protein